jgi:trehalose utilization protein
VNTPSNPPNEKWTARDPPTAGGLAFRLRRSTAIAGGSDRRAVEFAQQSNQKRLQKIFLKPAAMGGADRSRDVLQIAEGRLSAGADMAVGGHDLHRSLRGRAGSKENESLPDRPAHQGLKLRSQIPRDLAVGDSGRHDANIPGAEPKISARTRKIRPPSDLKKHFRHGVKPCSRNPLIGSLQARGMHPLSTRQKSPENGLHISCCVRNLHDGNLLSIADNCNQLPLSSIDVSSTVKRKSSMTETLRITVWGEFRHEKKNPKVAEIYPQGIHETIAAFLRKEEGFTVRTASLDEPEHGLSEQVLAETDVLLWWGHMAHAEVSDEVVERAKRRVLEGMGLIALHSAHFAKLFKALMGTTCSLKWREANDKERLWNILPNHPIARGIADYFEIPSEEMYGEPFGIPTPDELIFISWFTGGEVFRSGATWQRGHGRVFYFRPGHETYPTYHQPEVQQVITNAVHWARPTVTIPDDCPNCLPLETLPEDSAAAQRSTVGHK